MQGYSKLLLCPPNRTNKSALLRVRKTNGAFQEKSEANPKNKCICDKQLVEAVRHPWAASTPGPRICGSAYKGIAAAFPPLCKALGMRKYDLIVWATI
jgi:hypothetical protein